MQGEIAVIWVLLVLQMVALTLLVREMRRPGFSMGARAPSTATTVSRGQLAGGPFDETLLEPILPPKQQGGIHGYLFVLRSCQQCEKVLAEMDVSWNEGRDWGLTIVGAGGTRSQIEAKFGGKARELGAGLAACPHPGDFGVTAAPWLVVTNKRRRIVVDHAATTLHAIHGTLQRAEESVDKDLGLKLGPISG